MLEDRLRSHYESLSRAIGFTRAADAKAGPVLALQVALAGTLAARMDKLWLILMGEPFGAEAGALAAVLVVYVLLLLISMALAASVYVPRNPGTGRSLIYFEDIGVLTSEEFAQRAVHVEASEIERQLIGQVHVVSTIASKKMGLVRRSYWVAGPSVLLWVLLLAWGSI